MGVPFPHEKIQSDSFNIRYMQTTATQGGMMENAGQVTMFDKIRSGQDDYIEEEDADDLFERDETTGNLI